MADSLVLGAVAAAKAAGLPRWALSGLLLLAAAADEGGEVEMSAKETSCWLRVSLDTAKRILRELVRSGFLHIVRRGRGGRPNRYAVNAAPLTRGSEVDPCRS